MRADRRRELGAITTAFVAHILFLTLAPHDPPVEKEPPLPADVAADTTIDIDSTGNEAPNPAVRQPATNVPSEMARAAIPPSVDNPSRAHLETPPVAAPALAAPEEDPEEETEPDKPVAPAPPTAPAESTASAETGPVKPGPASPSTDEYGGLPSTDPAPGVPGLSGPLWAIPGVVPSTGAPKPAPTTIAGAPVVPADIASRVLSGTMHSRDKTVGIEVPAAGVVAGTIADALRGSALTDAKGTFEVKLGANGTVESVRFVGSSDGDASQWSAVADAARRTLAGKTLQMGSDKQGVTVVVKVESKVQYPAGTKERVDVKPVCANEVIEQMAMAIEGAMQGGGMVRGIRDDQGRFIPYNELDDERRLKFCIPIGIKAVVDPANIGAHMTNVVSSSFQVKRVGEQALPMDAAMPIDRGVPWLPVAEGKTRAPPPPPKKKWKKKKPRRGSVVPVEINR